MAANGSQMLPQININDRLSQLPDELLHQVLSHLDIKVVVQTCVIARRWRSVWKSTPYLNFHMNVWRFKAEKLYNFSTNPRRLRNNSITVETFGLVGEQTLAMRNAGELHLENIHYQEMSALVSATQVQLKTLNLTRVHAYSIPNNQTLDFSSPIMETLILNDFYHPGIRNLRITAPQLRVLNMYNDSMGDNRACVLTVDTPRLRTFQFKRNMYGNYFLQNLLNLETADIEIDIERKEGRRLGRRLHKFLTGISNARSLTLSFKGYKVRILFFKFSFICV